MVYLRDILARGTKSNFHEITDVVFSVKSEDVHKDAILSSIIISTECIETILLD